MLRVRLTKKLAAVMNGVDVSSANVGDILELPDAAAHMMIAEGWAEPVESAPLPFSSPAPQAVAG
jgi:hypothetical protein